MAMPARAKAKRMPLAGQSVAGLVVGSVPVGGGDQEEGGKPGLDDEMHHRRQGVGSVAAMKMSKVQASTPVAAASASQRHRRKRATP